MVLDFVNPLLLLLVLGLYCWVLWQGREIRKSQAHILQQHAEARARAEALLKKNSYICSQYADMREGLDSVFREREALRQYVEVVEARNGELAAELATEREKARSINARMVAAQNQSAARHRQPADYPQPHSPQGKTDDDDN